MRDSSIRNQFRYSYAFLRFFWSQVPPNDTFQTHLLVVDSDARALDDSGYQTALVNLEVAILHHSPARVPAVHVAFE